MEALTAILIDTYNPNHDLRVGAEKNLQQFLATPGSLTVLISTISANVHNDLRKATALIIKNRLRDYYSKEAKGLPSSDEEKAQFKHNLMATLLNEHDNSIRGILAESVRIVSEFEFPQNWPELLPTIITNIQSPDVLRVYNALLALRKLVKRYEYKDSSEREPLNNILQTLFPFLQELMKHIITNQSLEAAQVMRVCLKIFWSATNYQLPLVQGVDVALWFQIIGEVMAKVLPEASEGREPLGQPTDPDERKQWPWWRLKKWAARIMTHFIQRYGNPRYAPESTKAFSEYFRSTISVALLLPVMQNLEIHARGGYLTEHVHRACISYLANCAEMSPTYKVIKPHLEFLLFHVIFPTLCLTKEEVELFEDDPVEFVRKVHDPIGDWLSPSVAAINLLQMLGRYRQKDTMPLILPFLHTVLSEYNAAAPEAKDYRKKDGTLVAMAALSKIMSDSKEYSQHLFPFVVTHILPEFSSPVGFLRFRACWTLEHFADLNWHEQNIEDVAVDGAATKGKGKAKGRMAKAKGKKLLMTTGELLSTILQALLRGLRDPTLPVQSAAACSLRCLIDVDEAKDMLRPMLKDIVGEYFRIMEEVENESVLAALQSIVTEFGDSVKDFAPTMVQHLVTAFAQYSQETDDEEAAFSAVHCLDIIDATLEAVQDHPNVLTQLEPILQPLFLSVLQSGGDAFEYIDTIVHMISGLTYFADKISMAMWALCGPVIYTLNSWAIDYISEMMPPILNFMTKGMDLFLQVQYDDQPAVFILLEAIGKAYDNEEGYNGADVCAASTLLTCLLTSAKEQCPGKLHALLPRIMAMVYTRSTNVRLTSVKVRLLEVVMGMVYYDPAAALQLLAQSPQALLASVSPDADLSAVPQTPLSDYFFPWMFTQLKDMERDFSQRLVVLCFTSLLSLPVTVLPAILGGNLGAMFQQMIRELVMIEETKKKEAERGDDDNFEDVDEDDDCDDGDDDCDFAEFEAEFDETDDKQAIVNRAKALYVPDGGYDEEEDCVNAEDEEYRAVLEDMDKEERVKRQLGDDYSDDGDDDDDAYAYTSPIEQMDITQFFFEAMHNFSVREAAVFGSLRNGLEGEDVQRFEALYKIAQERKAQQA